LKPGASLRAAAVTALLMVAVAALSRVPYDAAQRTLSGSSATGEAASETAMEGVGPADATPEVPAVLRFSWRAASRLVEECRRLSDEDLARLPVHMRREEVCEGRLLPYRLRVTLNDRLVVDEIVEPAGARGDRPLFVFHELVVRPGEYRVEVEWERVRPDFGGGGEARNASGSTGSSPSPSVPRPVGAAETGTPAELELQATVRLEPRGVALVTYDPGERLLVARGQGIVAVESERDDDDDDEPARPDDNPPNRR
jgi:hypothetical protein